MIAIEFLGTYQTGLSPCDWLADGSRRRAVTTGFNVSTIVKGDLQASYIEIAPDGDHNSAVYLQEGALYSVSIALRMARFYALELGEENTTMTYQDPILKKEINSIEKKTA